MVCCVFGSLDLAFSDLEVSTCIFAHVIPSERICRFVFFFVSVVWVSWFLLVSLGMLLCVSVSSMLHTTIADIFNSDIWLIGMRFSSFMVSALFLVLGERLDSGEFCSGVLYV